MTQEIIAGGKKRPFLFSYSALKKFCKDSGKKLSDFSSDSLDFSDIESMMFRGFEAGAKKEGLVFSEKLENMEEWIDEDFGLIETVTKAIEKSFDTSKKNQGVTIRPTPTPQA